MSEREGRGGRGMGREGVGEREGEGWGERKREGEGKERGEGGREGEERGVREQLALTLVSHGKGHSFVST